MTSPHQDVADLVAELRNGANVSGVGPRVANLAAEFIEQQAKALSEAMKHLTILSDDMSDVVEAQYVDRKDYPSEARRYERDIAPVRAARSFLNPASNKEGVARAQQESSDADQ